MSSTDNCNLELCGFPGGRIHPLGMMDCRELGLVTTTFGRLPDRPSHRTLRLAGNIRLIAAFPSLCSASSSRQRVAISATYYYISEDYVATSMRERRTLSVLYPGICPSYLMLGGTRRLMRTAVYIFCGTAAGGIAGLFVMFVAMNVVAPLAAFSEMSQGLIGTFTAVVAVPILAIVGGVVGYRQSARRKIDTHSP